MTRNGAVVERELPDVVSLRVPLLLADDVDRLGKDVIGHQDRRLGLFELLCGPEGVCVVPVRVARQRDEPAAIGNEKWLLRLTFGLHRGNRRAWRTRRAGG